jgi:CHASE3 domain sensor protein
VPLRLLRLDINKVAAFGALACGLVGCVGVAVADSYARAADAEVDRVREVRDNLDLLFRGVLDAETGQRGYLLTGDANYLRPYSEGTTASRDNLGVLRSVAPQHLDELDRLGREIEDKFDELSETIQLVASGKKASAYTVVDSNRGKKSMERIRSVLNELVGRVNRDLSARRLDARSASQRAITTSVTFMVISAVLAGFSALGRERSHPGREGCQEPAYRRPTRARPPESPAPGTG